jgi:GT2 family glycosyltransferase
MVIARHDGPRSCVAATEDSTLSIDAVIVTRDRADDVCAALGSVREAFARAGVRGRTIVVDNASSDATEARVAREFPEAEWVQTGANIGFPSAVNRGLELGDADWVLLLNNDATIEREAVRRVFARQIPGDVGAIAMQMRFADRPNIVNSAGIGVDVLGVAYDRHLGTPADGPASKSAEVFGACAGAALYRRAMLDEIGRFDGGYFLYLEDVDVAWRSRMAGWRTLYVPDALVWHAHSGTSRHGSSFKYFHVGRSRMRLLAKNLDRRQLLRHGTGMLAYDIAYVAFVAVRDRTLAPLRGRIAGAREWRAVRAQAAATRRSVPLERRQGFAAALRRHRAWLS